MVQHHAGELPFRAFAFWCCIKYVISKQIEQASHVRTKIELNLMRMKKIRSAVLVVLAGMLAACGTTTTTRAPAPVVDRVTSVKTTEVEKPHVVARGNYLVKKGDTLYRIALEHGQNYRDIVAWNNLTNANDIKVDQILRVLPPESNSGGAQTGSVSPSGVEVRTLSSSGPAAAANAGNAANKTMPRGDKRAYSDGTLAEMQKTESAAAAVAVASVAKPIEAKTVEKTVEPVTGDEDGVAWMWPASGKVIATFDDGKSKGIDIAGKLGQHVVAAGSGKVMYAGSGIRGYGNLVIVKHTSSLLSAYAHNKSILVKEGESVSKGQKIAEMGNSDADAVKLHFEIRQQGKPVDPSRFLPNR